MGTGTGMKPEFVLQSHVLFLVTSCFITENQGTE
jgi:hypothetical protein